MAARTDHGSHTPSRTQRILLRCERSLRGHPAVVGSVAVAAVAVISVAKSHVEGGFSLALTYSLPLALCAYGVGVIAGTVMAVAVAGIWVIDALEVGLPLNETLTVFVARLLIDMAVVAFAALAAGASRARDRYLEEQQRLAHLRADLVAAFSHDLRGPLAAIVGYGELLQDERAVQQSAEAASAVDGLLVNARHLNDLISDMIGVEQSTTAIRIQTRRFSPQTLVAELRDELDPVVLMRPVALLWDVDPDLPDIETDFAKLTSIVRNLVTNALKFTRRGSITVHIGYHTQPAAHVIDVRDTGRGIAPAAMAQIFDRFYRAADADDVGGFGLGLFIAKRFVDLLGGTISVQSEVGRGSCFSVTIPHQPIARGAGTPRAA